ncbi:MAG: ABC transporter permease [Gammaproteobacteria bacterium]|jgi:putative ABC transport system permease protein
MLLNMLLLGLREIRRNLLRSSLTTLGIVIGVAAVITMVTLGNGATARVSADISGLGRNLVVVAPRSGRHAGPGQVTPPFRAEDARAIARDVSGIAGMVEQSGAGIQVIYANQNWSTTLYGTTNGFFQVREWPVIEGREFDETEQRAGRLVCILGATVREKLFGLQDPLGAIVRLGKLPCRVVGVLAPKGQSTFGQDQDDLVITPLKAFQRRVSGNRDIGVIFVSADNADDTSSVQQGIERVMRQRRHLSSNEENNFRVQDMREIANVVESATGVLTTLLSAIAAVSLVVGGIGIMNIMLVSVTERTREIGIRLAIGALEREVLLQFLVESVLLSVFGGLAGILFGVACSAVGARILNLPLIISPVIVVVAFVFSAAFGVAFGYAPARKAARLDPIEALRHE